MVLHRPVKLAALIGQVEMSKNHMSGKFVIVIVMRWQSSLKTAAVSVLGSILVAGSAGSEEVGRIRVTPAQVAGIYKLGSERVELKRDGTYAQDTISEA